MRKLASNHANYIANLSNISDVYAIDRIRFALQCIYSETTKLIILLIIFSFLDMLDYVFLMLILLLPRLLLGGKHCNTFFKCLLATIFFFITIPIISIINPITITITITTQVLFLVPLSILVLFTNKSNKSRPKRSRLYINTLKVLAFLIMFFSLFVINDLNNNSYISCAFITYTFIFINYIM